MIHGGRLEADQARELVQACFHDLAQETESWGGFMPETSDPPLEITEQKGIALERIGSLRSMILAANYDGTVKATANEVLGRVQYGLSDMSPAGQADILNGVARALIEQQNLFIHRLTERLLPLQVLLRSCSVSSFGCLRKT